MFKTLWAFRSCDNNLDIFGEYLREPKCNVGFFPCFAVNELINSFNDNNDFVVNLLCTVNDELFLNFCTADIQPVGKEFSDVFLKQIDILFKFEGLSEFDDDSVERVKIIAIVTAVRGKVHDREGLLFAIGIGGLAFLPVD